jgi:hypothetical protein
MKNLIAPKESLRFQNKIKVILNNFESLSINFEIYAQKGQI